MGVCASRHENILQDSPHSKSLCKDDQFLDTGGKASLHHCSRPQQQQTGQQQSQPAVQLAAEHLLDDTLGEVLTQMPLNHLIQLSCCSKRLLQLVFQSDKVLRTVDLRQLLPHQLEPALLFLANHPAADAIRSAVLPSNCYNTTAALKALSGLRHLEFYYAALQRQLYQLHQNDVPASKPIGAAAAAAGPPPDLAALPLQQLCSLQTLTLSLESGDIRPNQRLHLPTALQGLAISAPSLGSALNPLDLQNLKALSSLNLNVLDASSKTCLAKLIPLDSLRKLVVGNFGTVPEVVHNMTQLSSLKVGVCSQIAKHSAADGLEGALRAAAYGLMNLPTRPNMQMQVQIAVLSHADGLAADWGMLHNLRSLTLTNIYPMHTRGFALTALGGLGRLTALQLGFEGQQQVQGQQHHVELVGLNFIIHLKALVVTCTGGWMDAVMEPPPHLTSLIVACNGRVQLVAPGHAAAAAAAALISNTSQSYSAGRAHSSGSGSGSLAAAASWPLYEKATAAAAAADGVASTRSVNLGMLYEPHLWQQGQQQSASGGDEHRAAAAAADTAAGMMMQRKLNRLGDIEETAETYLADDEAQQLQHIHRLGILAGRGIYIQDAAAAAAEAASTGRSSLSRDSSSSSRPGSAATRGGMTGKLVRRLSLTRRDDCDSDVLPFADWLVAKNLTLSDLGLVQQQLPAAAATATLRRSSSLSSSSSDKVWQGRRSSIGRRSIGEAASTAACNVLLIREHMQEELERTFQELGFL